MNKYNLFLGLINENFATLIESGVFKEKTLTDYITYRRRAKPVTIIAATQILHLDFNLYV